jgi:riboflavin kinase/FMN adenylyltransferase
MTESKRTDVSSFDALGAHGLKEVAVAVGVFDGVHLGHQKLLEELKTLAGRLSAHPVAVTFHPHPRELLRPEAPPALLLPPSIKTRLLHEYGAEAVVTIPFTPEFAALSPPEFLYDCLSSSRVELKGRCVGARWRFGSGGTGNAEFLKERAKAGNFEFVSVEELSIGGMPVSSTNIRRALASGDLKKAKAMLGRNYSLYGKVEHGRQVASSILNKPTANLKFKNGVLPPCGVYAGWAHFDGQRKAAAIAVGSSPTFKSQFGSETRVEVHLIDFSGDLYGKELEAEFAAYIREERCFSSVEALKKQIGEDVQAVIAALKGL